MPTISSVSGWEINSRTPAATAKEMGMETGTERVMETGTTMGMATTMATTEPPLFEPGLKRSVSIKWNAVDSFGSFFGLFAPFGQPVIELRPRILGHVDEAQAGAARVIHPRNLHFWFQRGGDPR